MAASGTKTAVYAAIVGNFALAVLKVIVAVITGSAAMLSESIHSFVDTGNGGLLLLGMNLSKRPADDDHPFGHGLELYFWTLVVSILIFAGGGGVSAYEGVLHVMHPREVTNFGWIYFVLCCGIVFEGAVFYVAIKAFMPIMKGRSVWQTIRTTKDPTVFAVLLEDFAALSGLVVALVGSALVQFTGIMVFDGIASIVIGVLLMGVALVLAWESRLLLIGEGADREMVANIRAMVTNEAEVLTAKKPLTMYFGPNDLLVNLDVQFKPDLTAVEMEAVIDRIERLIRESYQEVKHIFIEMESLRPKKKAKAKLDSGLI